IAFGNARNNNGNQNFFQKAQTPYIARLLGTNESPTGDPDGAGTAAVTIDIINDGNNQPSGAEICWDLNYTGILAPPIQAHIHAGGPGVNGVIIVPFSNLGASSATGCSSAAPAVVQQIIDNPGNFYVNVHTTDFPNGAIRGQLSKGPIPAGEAHMLAAPLRAYDSRANNGPKIAAGETRTIPLTTGVDGQGARVVAVPAGATAAIVTLTVTETVAGGYLKMYSAATTEPATSSINWFANNQTFAVSTQVAVDASGQVKITSGPSATQFIVDVVGYLF
ncbi:MAG TPA: CHRD domain-containing protein, partial [Ilumatobacteraceae bacterium]